MNRLRSGIILICVLALAACTPVNTPVPPLPATDAPDDTAATRPPALVLPPPSPTAAHDPTATPEHPLAISRLKRRDYPASPLVIEETLSPGSNYTRSIASYTSDGYRIYGLLTVPAADRPENGYPVIIFLHGYINPAVYVTTQDYVASQDGLARAGFITYKPDLRGHGKSEGVASGAHFSQDYVVDTLNALSALQQFGEADAARIGVWGHSNGGEIGLRAMVVSPQIKAGVFWAGVVGSYEDMLETHNAQIPFMRRGAPELVRIYGKPSANPAFWDTIDPYAALSDISGPISLHHGEKDEQVPDALSRHLYDELILLGRQAEIFIYPDADHNLSGSAFGEALERSVAFFRDHL